MKRSLIWNLIYTFGILIALVSGLLLFQQGKKPAQTQSVFTVSTPTPTIVAEQEGLPTTEEIDLSQYNITVLNGSGKKGEAAKVKELLGKEKYQVVTIGNADKQTYKETIIKITGGVKEPFIDKLKSTLSKLYLVKEEVEKSGDSKSDVVLIIGSEKAP